MAVDYSMLRVGTKTYSLNAAEVPAYQEFHVNISPVLARLSSFPTVEFALFLYSADDGERLDFSAAVTALDTKDRETEGLTYRLSMRVANLLGPDATARRAKFNEMKKFYNLRSKIVHGSAIAKTSLNRPLDGLAQLRETVRRVLLSALALFADGKQPDQLPELIDDLAFDEEKRKLVQSDASKYLHANRVRVM